MNWTKAWGGVKDHSRCTRPLCRTVRDQNGIPSVGKRFYSPQEEGRYHVQRKTSWMFNLPCVQVGTVFGSKNTSHRYVHSMQNDPDLSRDFFVRLGLADKKKTWPTVKRRHKVLKSNSSGETIADSRTFPGLIERMLSGALDKKSYDKVKSGLKQPPTSQSITGTLEPMSLEEVMLSCSIW